MTRALRTPNLHKQCSSTSAMLAVTSNPNRQGCTQDYKRILSLSIVGSRSKVFSVKCQ
jgi:hypothetical protein